MIAEGAVYGVLQFRHALPKMPEFSLVLERVLTFVLQNATAELEQPLSISTVMAEQAGSGRHGRRHIFGGGRSQAAVDSPVLPGNESQPENQARREHIDAETEAGSSSIALTCLSIRC